MGGSLGVPDWVAATGLVVGGLAILLGIGWLNVRRVHIRLAARRPNPTEAEFLAMMAQDCSPKAARFVWQQALIYVAPRLAPHPDDHLLDDLCIDDDDIDMDWVSEWADQRGVPQKTLPEWPEDWPLTLRNFARWLDLPRLSAAA